MAWAFRPRLLEHLHLGLVAVDDERVQQRVAQQVDHRLRRLAHPHDAGGQRVARQLRAAEATQQRGLAVQRQAIQVLRRDHPGQRRLAEQALGDHLRRLRRQAQATVTARAGVLHPLVADHAHLLRDDVHLLADFHADLAQGRAVVRAHALVFGQFVAPHIARQGRIQRLAAALGALVRRHLDLVVFGLGGCRLGLRAFDLGLVEEQVLLVRGADFALGVEELALEAVELLLEQVAFGAHHAQLAQCVAQAPSSALRFLRAWACGSSARILFIAPADVAPDPRISP